MTIAKSSKWMVVVILLVVAVALVLFVRMYRGDIKALHSFLASYEDFDRAIVAAAEGRDGPAGLGQAEKALTELQAKASMRLSSLIRNDGDLMVLARDVAALSRRELDRLRALDVRKVRAQIVTNELRGDDLVRHLQLPLRDLVERPAHDRLILLRHWVPSVRLLGAFDYLRPGIPPSSPEPRTSDRLNS